MAALGGGQATAQAQQARQIQKVYSEWCVKAAEIVLASRIDGPAAAAESPLQASASFGLRVPERFGVRNEGIARPEFFQLKMQRSFQVEVYLAPPDDAPSAGDEEACQLLERWTFTFFPANPEPSSGNDRCNQTLVQKQRVTLRSLLCFVRTLPAYSLCRQLAATGAAGGNAGLERRYGFRVEAWPPTSRAASAPELLTQDFVSLQSSVGTLRLSVGQRKDVKALLPVAAQQPPPRGPSAFGSQLEQMDMEEGYFTIVDDGVCGGAAASGPSPSRFAPSAALAAAAAAAASTAMQPARAGSAGDGEAGLGASRLGKIAEEPEARRSVAAAAASSPKLVPRGTPASPQLAARSGSPRTATGGLEAVVAVTPPQPMSPGGHSGHSRDASRPSSAGGERGVDASAALASTPPVQGARARLCSADSASSSLSNSSKEAPALFLGSTPPLASGLDWRSPGSSFRGNVTLGPSACSSRSQTPHSTPTLGPQEPPGAGPAVAAGFAGRAVSPGLSVSLPPVDDGDLDDLSNIWMRPHPEWGRRRTMSMGSRGSRGGSRSPSLENSATDGVRRKSVTSSLASLEERCCGTGTTSAKTTADDGAGEICMHGMSSDEDDNDGGEGYEESQEEEDGEDDEDELLLQLNVVASVLKGGGGGAFASPGASKMGAMEAFASGLGADPFAEEASATTSRRNSRASPLLKPVEVTRSPFSARGSPGAPPLLELPSAALGAGGGGAEGDCGLLAAAAATEGGAASGEGAAGGSSPAQVGPDVQQLVEEMGELMCLLQQQHQDLAIYSQEVQPEELLDRLEHFREVARDEELLPRRS